MLEKPPWSSIRLPKKILEEIVKLSEGGTFSHEDSYGNITIALARRNPESGNLVIDIGYDEDREYAHKQPFKKA